MPKDSEIPLVTKVLFYNFGDITSFYIKNYIYILYKTIETKDINELRTEQNIILVRLFVDPIETYLPSVPDAGK